MSKARVGQDSLDVNDEVADVDEKAASADVGIDVVEGEDDASNYKADGDSQLKENRPRRRRRNIIIGIIVILIVLVAIAVGAALGTKKNGDASSTKQSGLTTIDVEGLALELKGVSGPLSADAAAVFGTEYCNHFKDYYNNVGPTRDEMPSLQRNIDVADCSIEVDRRRLLRRQLAVTGHTATMPGETLVLSFSQSTTIEASNDLFIPIPHILTAPLESDESKEILSDNVSDALLEAGIDDFEDIEIGELLLPESSAPPLPASIGHVDNPICPLCPEAGWAMDPAMAGNTPLQGYAADITAALDPYLQYEYILAVLTFEQSNCKEIESVLRSKKLNSLLSGKEWAEKTCDKLQSHMMGRCCTIVGMLSPVDPLPEPLPDSDIDPPLESTPGGNKEDEESDGWEPGWEPPLVDRPPEEDGGRDDGGGDGSEGYGDDNSNVPDPDLECIPPTLPCSTGCCIDNNGGGDGGGGGEGEGGEGGGDGGDGGEGSAEGDDSLPDPPPLECIPKFGTEYKLCADGSCKKLGDYSDCCDEDSCKDLSCPGTCGCGREGWIVCDDGGCVRPLSCCPENRCDDGFCPGKCGCGKRSCGPSTPLCCEKGQHCCTHQDTCTADSHECYCLSIRFHDYLYQHHCG